MPQLACTAFVTVDEVLDSSCACDLNEDDHGALLADLIDDASDMLYVLSGGRVFGRCSRTVWPVKVGYCPPSYDLINDRSSWVNWDSVDSIPLAGPNTEIMEVTIDGIALNPSEYMLLNGNKLVRRVGYWPTSNNLTLTDAEEGTFTITFRFGRPFTTIDKRAAIELVCQMANDEPRALSRLRGVVSANVQGVSVQLDPDEVSNLGLPEVNRFLDTYAPRGIAVLGVYTPELTHGWRLHTVTGGSGS
jgi:hypothetical protein